MGYTQPEVEFVVAVVTDHENIYKEKGRSGFMDSPKRVDRAKAVMFLADTLTGVLKIEDKKIGVDEEKLRDRFEDLYFRHIDVSGKVFRPEWGLFALEDYRAFIGSLAKRANLAGVGEVMEAITESAKKAIERAKVEDDREKIDRVEKVKAKITV
jgi:hypothetical protein